MSDGSGAGSPEDIPWMMTAAFVDRLAEAANEQGEVWKKHFALKGVNEFARHSVEIGLTDAETMANQLEAMASYLRRHH